MCKYEYRWIDGEREQIINPDTSFANNNVTVYDEDLAEDNHQTLSFVVPKISCLLILKKQIIHTLRKSVNFMLQPGVTNSDSSSVFIDLQPRKKWNTVLPNVHIVLMKSHNNLVIIALSIFGPINFVLFTFTENELLLQIRCEKLLINVNSID